MQRSRTGAILIAAAALVASGCGGDEDELSRSHPGKDLIPITAFDDRGRSWEFRAYEDRRKSDERRRSSVAREGCIAYSTPTTGGLRCFVQVPGDKPAEATMIKSGGREAVVGLAASDVAAVRYRTRYGPAIAETRRVPGFRLRFFLAMHDTGVARHVLNPVAIDARGDRVGAR